MTAKPESTRRDWLSIGLLDVTALAAVGCVIMIYLFMQRPPAPTTWQFNEFKFTEALIKSQYSSKTYHTTIVFMDYDSSSVNPKLVAGEPERVGSADYILNRLGNDGWDLAWSDGVRYIVKRPSGKWQHQSFYLSQQEDENSSAK